MRQLRHLAVAALLLLTASTGLGAEAPKPAEMDRVRVLAGELKDAAIATARAGELWAHSFTAYEARTLHRLRNVELKARYFAETVAKGDASETVTSFAALYRDYCRAGDVLYSYELYGPYGPARPFRGIDDLGPAHASFQRVRAVMNELRDDYGYEDCGVYSRFWSDDDESDAD